MQPRALITTTSSTLLICMLAACGGGGSQSTTLTNTPESTPTAPPPDLADNGNPPPESAPTPPSSDPVDNNNPPPVTSAGGIVLNWTAPSVRLDGSVLNDLAGYEILYGTSRSVLNHSIVVNDPSISSYEIPDLNSDTYYFVVRSFNLAGIRSPYSNVVSYNQVASP